MKPLITIINNINLIKMDIKSLKEMEADKSKDEDMKKLLEEEMKTYEEQMQSLEEEIVQALIKQEDKFENCTEIIMEISAGVGGQEAMLFAQEISNMYENYALYKNWDCSTPNIDVTDIGGTRQTTLNISGSDCFSILKYEGGVHRVQRIPKTEKSGRIHTSTVSIAILPQPKDIQIDILDKDLKIETKRASGPGGQSVNKTDSAIRLTHIPSGIVVECQEERSQIKNKIRAISKLKILLYESKFEKQESESRIKRKIQIGRKNRNEKIRTYNYIQDRITDHRIHRTMYNVDTFLSGSTQLDELISEVRDYDYEYRINQLLS